MSLPETFVEGFHDENLCKLMEYKPFGKTGLKISKISIGGGTLSHFYGYDEEEAIATVQKAIKSGINYIDTAYWYGQGSSETLLGKALKDVPREAYYIGTKIGRYELEFDKMFDFSAKMARKSFERSLKLLGLDYVDVIQIHDIEFASDLDIILNETIPELEKFVKEGKAKFIGITGYPLSKLKELILAAPGKLDMLLTYTRYSLLDDSLLEYLPFFEEQNLGVICASSHAMGLLTNNGPQNWHPAPEELKTICKKASEICKSNNIELGKLAMYHALQLKGPTTFLSGMQTRKLLEVNLSSLTNELTKKEQEVLKQLKETLFQKTWNWEGIEVERYHTAMKEISKGVKSGNPWKKD